MATEDRDGLGRALLWTLVLFGAASLARTAEGPLLRLLLLDFDPRESIGWQRWIALAWPLAIVLSPWLGAVRARRRLAIGCAALAVLAFAAASTACFMGTVVYAELAAFAVAALAGAGLELIAWGTLIERCAERRRTGLYLVRGLPGAIVTGLLFSGVARMTASAGLDGWSQAWGVSLGVLALCAVAGLAGVALVLPDGQPAARGGNAYTPVLRELFGSPLPRAVLIAALGWSLAQALADVMFPLTALTAVADGGLGLTNAALGALMGVSKSLGGVLGVVVAAVVAYRWGVRRTVSFLLASGVLGLAVLIPVCRYEVSSAGLHALVWFRGVTDAAATTALTLLAMHAAAASSHPLACFALIWGGAGALGGFAGKLFAGLAGATGWSVVATGVAAGALAAMWLLSRERQTSSPAPAASV